MRADSIISGRPGTIRIEEKMPTKACPSPIRNRDSLKASNWEGPTKMKATLQQIDARMIRTLFSIVVGTY